MKVAVFARYSSKMQDAMSLDAQISEMESYCNRQGLTITHRFLLPETASQDLAGDPQFLSMLDSGKRREFDLLLCHKLDRLGRDLATTVQAKALLRQAGVKVKSVVENLGDTIQDSLIENVLAVVSQFYSQNLGQETKKGHRQLTRQGLWRGGKVPFGYQAVKVPSGNKTHTRLEPDPVTGGIMADVFKKFAAGGRTGDIIEFVQQATGDRWSFPTLYSRVKNPIYYGLLELGKTQLTRGTRTPQAEENLTTGQIEGVVSKEVWLEANRQITARAVTHSQKRAPKRTYLLSEGVATCADCGRPLVGNVMHGTPRYTCAGYKNQQCAIRKGVDAEEVEAAIFKVFAEEMDRFDVDGFAENYRATLQPEIDEARAREGRLRSSLTEVRKKSKNLAMALANGLDVHAVSDLLKELQSDERVIVDEITRCQVVAEKNVRDNVELVRQYLTSFRGVVNELTPVELKEFYQLNLRIQWDIEKQEGQLCFKLAPNNCREVSLRGYPMVGVHGFEPWAPSPPELNPLFMPVLLSAEEWLCIRVF